MLRNLLLSKRMFLEGVNFAEHPDPVSSGLAISLFQDAIEIYIWALIKERSIPIKEGSSFTANIETIQKAGISLNYVAKIFELNKARVNFKHYGNLPDQNEASKFQSFVDEFLRMSCQDHFGLNFDDISLTDLISDKEVSSKLKEAEELSNLGDFRVSVEKAAIARSILFSKLDRYIPTVDLGLKEVDVVLRRIPDFGASHTFRYLSDYLSALRETTLASLLRLPLKDYVFVKTHLPPAMQFGDGRWQVAHRGLASYDAATCQKAIACLVNISIRLEAIL